MAYFEWANDLIIDGGPIDEDHRKLVDSLNQLHTATTEGRGREVVGGILKQLIADTADHLHREEQQMAAAKYPHLDRHRVGHDHFVRDLRHLLAQYEEGRVTVAAQLSTVLRDWLSLHIRRYDKELINFLKHRPKA